MAPGTLQTEMCCRGTILIQSHRTRYFLKPFNWGKTFQHQTCHFKFFIDQFFCIEGNCMIFWSFSKNTFSEVFQESNKTLLLMGCTKMSSIKRNMDRLHKLYRVPNIRLEVKNFHFFAFEIMKKIFILNIFLRLFAG